jgi:alkyldihydroxyacetonephosphate synthase
VSDLSRIVGENSVSELPADRMAYSRDLWPRGLIDVMSGRPVGTPPDAVVWPESPKDVVKLVKWAAKNSVPLVPYGAGSGVCGGAWPERGQVTVDLKRMARVLWLEPEAHLMRAQAGIVGQHLEDYLGRRGMTMGHFPSSIFCSTLGGWLAARSAGQTSTKYGKIEDMAVSVQVVTGTGDLVETASPSGPTLGPDWTQLFIGSEGTLGIITAATMKVHPSPEATIYHGYSFPRISLGLEAIRRVMQKGLKPSVVRLYDEFDTFMARSGTYRGSEADTLIKHVVKRLSDAGQSFLPWMRRAAIRAGLNRPGWLNRLADEFLPRVTGSGCLLVVGCEGERSLTEAEAHRCHQEVIKAGATDLGAGPGLHWAKTRYDISFKMSKAFHGGAFADTMEVAATWDKIVDLYDAVKRAITPHAFIMAHFSHAYPEGCSIYFTFAGSAEDPEEALKVYDRIWQQGLSAVTRVGGTISHHHGVGKSKQRFMVEEHGDSLELFKVLKKVLDPNGILNPGKMSV